MENTVNSFAKFANPSCETKSAMILRIYVSRHTFLITELLIFDTKNKHFCIISKLLLRKYQVVTSQTISKKINIGCHKLISS